MTQPIRAIVDNNIMVKPIYLLSYNAIAAPANGLMVYNTDLNTPCFYDGGALLWKKVSHSNM
jgi:hypothetical protein